VYEDNFEATSESMNTINTRNEIDKAVEMIGITKVFGSVVANDHVDFDLQKGEIHCLLGENGAGKTTLMNTLYGMWNADEGEIYVEGEKVKFRSPKQAMDHGIGMVSQHFNLIAAMTVTENIVLAKIPIKGKLFVDETAARAKVLRLAENLGFNIDPDCTVSDLSVGEQQRVEILKALYRDAEIILLDEPTAVLAPQEIEDLFRIMKRMVEEGHSVVIITHKLKEALKSDRITVMRDGRTILTKKTSELQPDELPELMFGRKIIAATRSARRQTEEGKPILVLENVSTDGVGSNSLKDLSICLFAGEILGIAGVAGNGQKALADVIIRVQKATSGRIVIKGQDITNRTPKSCRNMGVACIPEERKKSAMLPKMGVAENLILGREGQSPFSDGFWLNFSAVGRFASEMISAFSIKVGNSGVPIEHLSGGNVQKVILARELSAAPELIIASQPTRGLDAETVSFIHRRLREERERGKAILLISYDLDEIMALADRVGVFFDGKLCMAPRKDPHLIGKLMLGLDA